MWRVEQPLESAVNRFSALVDVVRLQIIAKPTHWRLIWEGERYRDDVVRDESQYF
ncbi:hypothetical protein [Burkholderia gladioli]|uniref:hypothetical protein n=1 Tax=Burkholderia gladioli TaxID=28095 RepID=UPI00163F7E47|nr:hypothetical protein [Burkholderia gladioli]MDN7754161.1 hypothetical protein [Burkholderia gladioli]